MAVTKFTFIIPHKNTPDLLQKCLCSIPRREDVQIIVVDDDSNPQKVNFSFFPGLNDPFVEVYLTKEGRGAGYARNVGLEHAVGKWVIFVDADDFLYPEVDDVLDQYLTTEYDVVFFKGSSVKIKDGTTSYRYDELNSRIDKAIRINEYTLPLLYSCPWGKLFSREFLLKNNIRFNETKWGNDVVFMGRVALAAKSVTASSVVVYCVTESGTSLVANKTLDSCVVRLTQEIECAQIVKERYPKETSIDYWLFQTWFSVYRNSKFMAAKYVPKMLNVSGFNFVSHAYKAKFGKRQ